MTRLLVRAADWCATFDDDDTELRHTDVLVEDGVIAAVGVDLAVGAVDRVVDGRGLVLLPGLVNSHQHLYQGACRAVPHLERALIGPWLGGLGALVKGWWQDGRFGPDAVQAISAAGLTESLLGGVTTVADQHYFFPAGPSLDYVEATVAAAHEVGVRLTACRGSITEGPDPDVTQSVDEVARHCETLIDALHDASPSSPVRIALAPCGPHVDRPELFDELAALAADHDAVRLHTHLYEHVDDEVCRARHGCTPWELLAAHGWAQDRTWLAHVVNPPPVEVPEIAAAGVGISHLIAPDLRMGWGAAPVRSYLDAGCTVGFGTTGSASNDGADLLGDLRLALLAHRSTDPDDPERWLTARELLRAATRGSADCLGRPELGRIAVGARADLAAWDLTTVDRVGVHDPVAGLLLTGLSSHASLVVVEGEVLVERGTPTKLDVARVAVRGPRRGASPPLTRTLPVVGEQLRIETTLEPRGPAAAIVLTDAQVERLAPGKKSFPVKVTIKGTTLPLRIARMGDENLIGFSKAKRAEAGVDIGGTYRVAIEPDLGERQVDIPEDLAAALKTGRVTKQFDALAYSHRKEYVRRIMEAKKPETRARRIAETVTKVRAGETG